MKDGSNHVTQDNRYHVIGFSSVLPSGYGKLTPCKKHISCKGSTVYWQLAVNSDHVWGMRKRACASWDLTSASIAAFSERQTLAERQAGFGEAFCRVLIIVSTHGLL